MEWNGMLRGRCDNHRAMENFKLKNLNIERRFGNINSPSGKIQENS